MRHQQKWRHPKNNQRVLWTFGKIQKVNGLVELKLEPRGDVRSETMASFQVEKVNWLNANPCHANAFCGNESVMALNSTTELPNGILPKLVNARFTSGAG